MPTAGRPSIVRTSSLFPVMRTASTAPCAARMPAVRCAPSNAGPEGQEQETIRPPCSSDISVFVPMSSASTVPVARCASVASSIAT